MSRAYPSNEEMHQISLFRFFDVAVNTIPALRLAFHTPNGGFRAKTTAVRFKQLGVKSGVPDVLIPVPSGEYVGLAIELKHGSGRVSVHQQSWLDALASHHWSTHVVYDWTHAAAITCQYFQVDPETFGLHHYNGATHAAQS
jgi:hypothetical protein